jgi:hypothetical protein
MRREIAVVLALAFCKLACATMPEPIPGDSAGEVDALELFHRARFAELVELQRRGQTQWVSELRPSWVSEQQDISEWNAKVAYRKGDGRTARVAVEFLPENNRTRRLVTALLDNADLLRPLRRTTGPKVVELTLDPRALHLGFPVVVTQIAGRRFRMVWDTGAVENVLSQRALEELELVRTEVQYAEPTSDRGGFIVRFAAAATPEVALGPWRVENVPWLVADLGHKAIKSERATEEIDGFLSPQLLLPNGCFVIDRGRATLVVATEPKICKDMLATAHRKTPLFGWNGSVYASAQIERSPALAMHVETGSPVTFLHSDATRYLPRGALDPSATPIEIEGTIAQRLTQPVQLDIAGKRPTVTAIDLSPVNEIERVGHDDIGSVGNDVLLSSHGVIVSFASMEMALIEQPVAVVPTTSEPSL